MAAVRSEGAIVSEIRLMIEVKVPEIFCKSEKSVRAFIGVLNDYSIFMFAYRA